MFYMNYLELKKFSKNDTNLIFELDGDSNVMRYITLGKPKTMGEVKKESMPRILGSYTNGINYGIFSAHLKFSKNDINLLYELDGDSDVMKYLTLGKPKTIDEVKKESMPRIVKSYTNGINYGIFPAYLKCNNTYIGWFQFEKDKHIKNAIEVGWRLKKEHWGNGYATEVGLSLVKKAEKLNKKIVARAMIDNQASIRVMKKIGLKFVKEFWGDYEPHSGTPDVLYELS